MTHWLLGSLFCGAWAAAAWRIDASKSPWFRRWLAIQAVQAVSTTLAGAGPDWYWIWLWMPMEGLALAALLIACAELLPRYGWLLGAIGGVLAAPLCHGLGMPGPVFFADFCRFREYVWIAVAAALVGNLILQAARPVCVSAGGMHLWVTLAAYAALMAASGPMVAGALPKWIMIRAVYRAGAVVACLVWAGITPGVRIQCLGVRWERADLPTVRAEETVVAA